MGHKVTLREYAAHAWDQHLEHAHVCVCMCARECACTCVRVRVCMCVYVCACVRRNDMGAEGK